MHITALFLWITKPPQWLEIPLVQHGKERAKELLGVPKILMELLLPQVSQTNRTCLFSTWSLYFETELEPSTFWTYLQLLKCRLKCLVQQKVLGKLVCFVCLIPSYGRKLILGIQNQTYWIDFPILCWKLTSQDFMYTWLLQRVQKTKLNHTPRKTNMTMEILMVMFHCHVSFVGA